MPACMKQITSILGSSGLLALAVAVLTGQMTWQAAVPAAVGSLALVLMQETHLGTSAQQASIVADVKSIAADAETLAAKPAAPAAPQGNQP